LEIFWSATRCRETAQQVRRSLSTAHSSEMERTAADRAISTSREHPDAATRHDNDVLCLCLLARRGHSSRARARSRRTEGL
jgi:phosphohistidine phosphatase SixA